MSKSAIAAIILTTMISLPGISLTERSAAIQTRTNEDRNPTINGTLAIAYSNNIAGYVEPCGWQETGKKLGGLYKKSTYLEQYRKNHGRIVTVDSGDLLNESKKITKTDLASARLKADLVAEIYEHIGIDAINVGELDLALGTEYLRGLEKKFSIPFISANLVDETGSLIFNPYIIKEINGMKVGIFGLMGDSSEIVSRLKAITGGRLSVKDPVQSAETIVEILNGKVDYIIALTHQNIGRNWIVARRVSGINLIVGGHGKSKTEKPYKAGDTFIVQSGEKGHYQGMFEVTLGYSKTENIKNTLVELGSDIPDNIRVKSMIEQYKFKKISKNLSAEEKIQI